MSNCKIKCCDNPAEPDCLCDVHYQSWITLGRPGGGGVCNLTDCERPAHSRGWCSQHWQRWQKNGDPRRTLAPSDSERFWAKVEKTDTCWLWAASQDGYGYGQFRYNDTVGKAYRYSFEEAHGPIPKDMMLDHVCGIRLCVRPTHLRVVTPKQNAEHATVMRSNNTSGHRGVTWDKRRNMWMAQVMHLGKTYVLGHFNDADEAGRVAAVKRNELFTHNDRDRGQESA